MSKTEEDYQHNDQANLLDFDPPSAQPPGSQTGTLSANSGPEHPPTNQVYTPTAIISGTQGGDGTVIDSSTLTGPQQEEGTPALPPRPPQTTTGGASMPDHLEDELAPPTAAANVPEAQHSNPIVIQLKGMFPDFDESVLESVLVSVNNNQDAAVDVLLGMSDPSYVSSHQTSVPEPAAANPSLDLDEALARQLMLEDERQVRDRRAHRHSDQSWPRRSADGRDDVPYATRQSNAHYPVSSSPPGQGNDFKDTFNQIAESGKRTFTSIFTRVKAKINEFEANRPATMPPEYPSPSWGTSTTPQYPSNVPYPQTQHSGSTTQSPTPAASIPSYYAEGQTASKMDRHAASQYFASEDGWRRVGSGGQSRGQNGPPPAPAPAPVQPEAQYYQPPPPVFPSVAPQQTQEVRGYDVDDTPAPVPVAPQPAIPSEPIPELSSDIPRPPTTQAGSPLNAAKFGLLPKRPVSLLRPGGSTQSSHDDDEDDDELDYMENPFEESRR